MILVGFAVSYLLIRLALYLRRLRSPLHPQELPWDRGHE